MNRIHNILRLYTNCFQPTMRLWSETWQGSEVRKVYDQAQTLYRRLLASGVVDDDMRRELSPTCARLDPILLKQPLEDNLKRLCDLADTMQGPSCKTERPAYGNTDS